MPQRNHRTAPTFSPLVKKCIQRAKIYRLENISKMRELNDYGYRDMAKEILQHMKEQFMPENYQDLLDEITQGIEIEYAILEEQESLIPELIAEDGPIEPWDYDLSASPGDCLLCPYCRCSMMNSQRNQQNFLLYECPNCTNHLLIENSGNTWNIHQFCDQLAQIFQRHQQSCCHSNAEIPNSVDMFLTFQQVNDVFMAYCDQCGYLEEIRLSR